ncbi:MAG: hypothetical protein SO016_08050 [Lachnospiraceae bacterium]|nr:hypothetical protein [Lachnospiraceae bacterium]
MKFRKMAAVFAAMAMMCSTVSVSAFAAEEATNSEAVYGEEESDIDKDGEYLSVYFDVAFEGEEVSAAEFAANLNKAVTQEEEVQAEDWMAAVKEAVCAANYEELALSYPDEKVAGELAEYGIDAEGENARYLACALDTDLVSVPEAEAVVSGDALPVEMAERILMNVIEARGEGRNYLGYSEDPDIYAKLIHTWNSFILYDDGTLSSIGAQAVEDKVVTGYNLKNDEFDARFLPELTLQYGHSDITHAQQLIGLLKSEDIQAKVQLEPKVSIYEYLLDWGPVPEEATPTYEVKQVKDDLYLVYAVEYDLKLEFDDEEDMLRFDDVIKQYAKKYEGNEEAVGLIYASWWQPLYSTTVEGMPEENYCEIDDCIIKDGIYSLHSFCMTQDTENVVKALQAMDDSVTVETETRYCNTAFYNYLSGADYQ